MLRSQAVQFARKIVIRGRLLEMVSNHRRQFVGVHERCGYSNGSLPIEVVEALFVGESLDGFFRKFGGVVDHDVVGWCGGSLVHVLWDEEEVEVVPGEGCSDD